MSRIEDALKKLQKRPPLAPPVAGATTSATHRSAVPIAQKKKISVEGEKHHVSEADLVRGGLLVPIEHSIAVADEFRKIKRPIIVNAVKGRSGGDPHMNIVMIASALPGAGKTFCAVNLAVSASLERELNVLLVDADVAKPHISRAFGLENAPGLIDLLLDDTLDIADTLVRTDLNDIQVLPAGRHHPQATELLASDRMSRVVKELSSRYPDRIVLLDSPPLLITSEAQALASQVGQIVLVIEAGSTSQQMLGQALETLDSTKAVNLVLNKTRPFGPSSYYGDHYGYGGYEEGT